MYSGWHLALKYFKYYLTAPGGKGHGIHSPFIFEFITKVLSDKTEYNDYKNVEDLRKQMLQDSRLLVVEDFGAGSELIIQNRKSIKSIARNAVKSKKYGQLLYRIAKFYQPKTILELGTSLGITTSYLALAQPEARIITMEGSKEIADIARNNFRNLALNNIDIVTGNFDNTLQGVIHHLTSIDFAFIDGNHRKEPTERYFSGLLPKIHNDSILVFDDIHWSREMEQAWATIREHPSVRCSIDLFFVGIAIFRQEFREKQHFCIRY